MQTRYDSKGREIRGHHSYAEAVLRFLISTHQKLGAPTNFPGFIETPGAAGPERQPVVFTPDNLRSTLAQCAADAAIHVCTLAIPGEPAEVASFCLFNHVLPDDREQVDLVGAVLLNELWVDLEEKIAKDGTLLRGDVRSSFLRRGRPDEEGADRWAVGVVLDQPYSYPELWDLIDDITAICMSKPDFILRNNPSRNLRENLVSFSRDVTIWPRGENYDFDLSLFTIEASRLTYASFVDAIEEDETRNGAVMTTADDVTAEATRWLASGFNTEIFKRLGRRRDRHNGETRPVPLVDGLLPKGTVTLLSGERGIGKSTLALDLCRSVASDGGDRRWLGQAVDSDMVDGVAVLLTGEDSDAMVNSRLDVLDPDDTALRLAVYSMDGRPLSEICEDVAAIPDLALLVVDPARRYLIGDEDGSDGVNEFCSVLEDLGHRTGAAVLVVHHLGKNAQPKSLQQVAQNVRGSGVWLDRPRMAIGMYRRGKRIAVGVCKHNMPPDYAVMEETLFRPDSKTLRLIKDGENSTVVKTEYDDDEAGTDLVILDAVISLRERNVRIMRRGATELWAQDLPELKGVGRDRIRRAVDDLIDEGRLAVGPDGVFIPE